MYVKRKKCLYIFFLLQSSPQDCEEFLHVEQHEFLTDDESELDDNYVCMHEELKPDDNNTSTVKPKNLNSLINNKSFSERVEVPINKTLGEIMLMLLKYSIANRLSFTGMTNLFQLVNSMFEKPILPQSKYLLDKVFNINSNYYEFHALCPSCDNYLGNIEDLEPTVQCDICSTNVTLTDPEYNSIFLLINPSTDIENLVCANWEYYQDIMYNQH